jgi:hypothetical protein
MTDFMNNASKEIIELVGSLVLAILGWLGVRATAWVNAHTHNAYVLGAFARLNEAVTTSVRALEQTVIKDTANGLNAAARATLKADCLAMVKALLGPKGLQALVSIVGLDQLDILLSNKIEATVLTVGQQSATAAQAALPPVVVMPPMLTETVKPAT